MYQLHGCNFTNKYPSSLKNKEGRTPKTKPKYSVYLYVADGLTNRYDVMILRTVTIYTI
jgi:hypothetical protein